MKIVIINALLLIHFARALDIKDVVIVVSSQSNKYHEYLGEQLKNDIHQQAQLLKKVPPIIHFSHIDFPHTGGWTILPLLPHLGKIHQQNSSWFLFIEDRTKIKLDKLIKVLEKYNSDEEIWLGHALHDREPTIIHHFAFFENPSKFKYPHTASGFAVSYKLLKKIASRWKERPSPTDFSIDHAFELALFIWDNDNGHALTHEPSFCILKEENCATYTKFFNPCKKVTPKESIYFAVKTCQKFHKDRVSVVKNTWGQQASSLEFFSDVKDELIPTVYLGVPNTEQGHCGKTIAIIKYVTKTIRENPEIKWVVVADDDTILSVARLQDILTCYDPSTSVALGERYGYNIYENKGYNYITGGGGIVLSRVLLEKLAEPGACECPSISSPDDMYLGICIARLGVDITHSPFFHQARPVDYAPEYLQSQNVVSFHKHWMVNPISIYKQWFTEPSSKTTMHNEL